MLIDLLFCLIIMKWLRYIIMVLISFGLGAFFTYLMQGYPTFEPVRNFIVGGLSFGAVVGVVFQAIGMLREWMKERKAEKVKRRGILEGYLQEHSRDLVNEVLKNWFDSKSVDIAFVDGGYCYSTPLANVYYEPHFKSRIMKPKEPQGKLASQTMEHLKEYPDEWALWNECKSLTESHLKNVVKMWESIEQRLTSKIPKAFVKWDARGVAPLTGYIPYYTVWAIHGEAKCFMRTGKLSGIFKIYPEKDYFRVGVATMYAKSPNEKLLKKFVDIVHVIAKDHDLLEQLKLLDTERENIEERVREFKRALDGIVDDFEKGHINLKGTCWRCKPWHNELASLR